MLDAATELALRRAKEILELEIKPDDKNFMRLMTLRDKAMAMVLSIQTRVDDGKLRRKGGDRLGEILEGLKAEGRV